MSGRKHSAEFKLKAALATIFVYDKTAPAIEDVILNIMKDVPQEDLDMMTRQKVHF